MKYLLALIFACAFSIFALAQEKDNDWSKFYQLKNEVKEIIVDVSKNNSKKNYKTEQDVGSVVVQYVARLQELKKKYPMDFNIVTTHREDPKEHEPKLFLTIVVSYKDELSQIVWGFNTLFFDSRIEFYSSTDDGKTKKTFHDLYNYLTLYEA